LASGFYSAVSKALGKIFVFSLKEKYKYAFCPNYYCTSYSSPSFEIFAADEKFKLKGV